MGPRDMPKSARDQLAPFDLATPIVPTGHKPSPDHDGTGRVATVERSHVPRPYGSYKGSRRGVSRNGKELLTINIGFPDHLVSRNDFVIRLRPSVTVTW